MLSSYGSPIYGFLNNNRPFLLIKQKMLSNIRSQIKIFYLQFNCKLLDCSFHVISYRITKNIIWIGWNLFEPVMPYFSPIGIFVLVLCYWKCTESIKAVLKVCAHLCCIVRTRHKRCVYICYVTVSNTGKEACVDGLVYPNPKRRTRERRRRLR